MCCWGYSRSYKGEKVIKKVLSVLLVLLLCSAFVVSASAVGGDYPVYSPVSGGAFVECQTVLGRGVLVLPINYRSESIGFIGTGNSLCNLLSSTINGYFYTEAGVQYVVRATRQAVFEYSTVSGYQTYYTDLDVTQIYNTNVELVDYSGSRSYKPYDIYESVVIILLTVLMILSFLSMFSNLLIRWVKHVY